jgi:hypothetical protein
LNRLNFTKENRYRREFSTTGTYSRAMLTRIISHLSNSRIECEFRKRSFPLMTIQDSEMALLFVVVVVLSSDNHTMRAGQCKVIVK